MSEFERVARRRQLQQELLNIAVQSKDNARRDVDLVEQCQKVIAQIPRPRVDRRRQLEQEEEGDYLALINLAVLAAQSKDNPRQEVDLLVRCQEVIAERLRVARRRLVDQENRRDYLEMVNLGKVSVRLQREYLEGATQLSLRRVFRPPRAQRLKNPPRTLLVRNVVSLK
jgi:hypothetical protein